VVAGVLARRGDHAGLVVLDESLHSDKPMLRRTAVDALGEMGTSGAVGLLRRLYETDSEGKRLALSGLRRAHDRSAFWIYLDAAGSEDPRIRTQGISGLGELRLTAGRPILHELMQSETDQVVALTAAWSLAASGDPRGLTYLAANIHHKREQVRDAVVGLLGSLDDERAVPLLRKVLATDPSETVRTTAAASLTRFHDASGLPLVRDALRHVDFRIRLAAAVSFLRMDYETAKPLVVESLESRDPLVRSNAYRVVGQNADRSVTAQIVAAARKEPDTYAKAEAFWTLGQIGGVDTIPLLLEALPGEDEEVRHASAEALILISDRLLNEH
jgi:HEAT repeat protein